MEARGGVQLLTQSVRLSHPNLGNHFNITIW